MDDIRYFVATVLGREGQGNSFASFGNRKELALKILDLRKKKSQNSKCCMCGSNVNRYKSSLF